MAGTKGPSNLYGNKNQKPTSHINYPYAKSFNQSTLDRHQKDHGLELGTNSINDYENSAIHFANHISTVADSFVDNRGITYKYNPISNKLIIIDKNGYIVSYFKPTSGLKYYNKLKNRSR